MRWIVGVVFILLSPSPGAAQKTCADGIACGDTCIPAGTVCRLGFVREAATDATADIRTTVASVRLRSQRAADSEPLALIPEGTAVRVASCDIREEWCSVEYLGQTGFVAGRELTRKVVNLAIPEAVPAKQAERGQAPGVDRGYYRDARGRCYTFTRTGRKAYVERRLCEGVGGGSR